MPVYSLIRFFVVKLSMCFGSLSCCLIRLLLFNFDAFVFVFLGGVPA